MKLSSKKILIASLAGLLSSQLVFATDVTWTSSTYGNWSNGANWSTTPATPATDGSDKIIFSLTSNLIFNTGIDAASWSVSGLEINAIAETGTTAKTSTIFIVAGALSGGAAANNQASTLSIGSGGITVNTYAGSDAWGLAQTLQLGSYTSSNVLTVNTTADQTWKAGSIKNGGSTVQADSGSIVFYANLTGSGVITLRGNDEDTAVSTDANRTAGSVKFASGNSTGFTGSFVLQSGGLILSGTSQLDRLGSNALTIKNANTEHPTNNSALTLENMNAASQTFKNDIVFQDAGSSYLSLIVTSTAVAGSRLAFSGQWSGAINDNLIINSNNGDNLLLVLQGNNSGLTTTKVATAGNNNGRQSNAAIWIKNGAVLLEHQNALGSGNNFSVSMGAAGSGTGTTTAVSQAAASLYTISGVNVGSLIYADSSVSTSLAPVIRLGLKGAGAAEYTGAVTMRGVSGTDKAASVNLTAQTGGTSTFSGIFIDQDISNNIGNATVTISGGGTVVMSGVGSTYKGSTSVLQGTTLLANGGGTAGSATGAGNLKVGAAAASFTATTTLNRALVTVSSKAGLVVGQTITGDGIPAGTIITYINPSSNTIEISQNATATSSVAASASAETGILGGTGRLAPGAGAGITVSNGSTIAPGVVDAIGTLTLDGGSTAATLLTMQNGAKFTFDLGTADTSDQLLFWNFSAGDLALDNNVIELSSIHAGSYTLMRFFSDAGLTGVDNSEIGGFLANLSLSGVDAASFDAVLSTSGNSLILTVAAVPEPSTWAMIVGGMGLLAMRMRRRG